MAKERIGLVHVYTGDGKGKTSAAMGLALRAVGQGLKVYIIQFLKGGHYTGEFIAGKNFLPNIKLVQYGKGCVQEQKQTKLQGFKETSKEIKDELMSELDNVMTDEEIKTAEKEREKESKEDGKEGEGIEIEEEIDDLENVDYGFFDFIRDEINCMNCRHCFSNDKEQAKFVKDAFERAAKITPEGEYDLIILDEINIAINLGFLKVEDVISLIDKKAKNTELVLTGRHAAPEILDKSDYVSEVKMIKHPFEKGVGARRGIEY